MKKSEFKKILKYLGYYLLVGWSIFIISLALSSRPYGETAFLYFSLDAITAAITSLSVWFYVALWPITMLPGIIDLYLAAAGFKD
jgi:hypothetical protein